MCSLSLVCKRGEGGESDGGKRAWGLAGGESGAVPSAIAPRTKNAMMWAFLLPTPHLLRLYHLFSFFTVLSGLLRCAVRMAGGAPRPESECKSTIPPLDPPCTFAVIVCAAQETGTKAKLRQTTKPQLKGILSALPIKEES